MPGDEGIQLAEHDPRGPPRCARPWRVSRRRVRGRLLLNSPNTPSSVMSATEHASVAASRASAFIQVADEVAAPAAGAAASEDTAPDSAAASDGCASVDTPVDRPALVSPALGFLCSLSVRNAAAGRPVGQHRTRRQRRQEDLPIRLGPQPRIAEHDDAEIVENLESTAPPLFQREHGLRQLILRERIAAAAANAFEPRAQQRIVRRGEGQLVDGRRMDSASPFTSTALPEAPRRQQHRIAEFAETRAAMPRAAPGPAPESETAAAESAS